MSWVWDGLFDEIKVDNRRRHLKLSRRHSVAQASYLFLSACHAYTVALTRSILFEEKLDDFLVEIHLEAPAD